MENVLVVSKLQILQAVPAAYTAESLLSLGPAVGNLAVETREINKRSNEADPLHQLYRSKSTEAMTGFGLANLECLYVFKDLSFRGSRHT